MRNVWYALVLAFSIGASADIDARGWGHYHGHPVRSHIGIGFYFGPPTAYPYYPYYGVPYPPYYPYYGYGYPPPVVAVPSQPPVYIEREARRAPSETSNGYWYYCAEPPGYYPYVKECGSEWQPVPARPPTGR